MNWRLLKKYILLLLATLLIYTCCLFLFALIAGPDRQCGYLDDIGACSYGQQVWYFLPFITSIALFLWPATLLGLIMAVVMVWNRRFKVPSVRTLVLVATTYPLLSLVFVGWLMVPYSPSSCNERLSNGKLAPYNSRECGR